MHVGFMTSLETCFSPPLFRKIVNPQTLFSFPRQQQQHHAKLLKIETHHMQETYKLLNHSLTNTHMQ
jgi:hypothetical protein